MDDTYRWIIDTKEGRVVIIIITPKGDTLKYGVQLQFPMTNNDVRTYVDHVELANLLTKRSLLVFG